MYNDFLLVTWIAIFWPACLASHRSPTLGKEGVRCAFFALVGRAFKVDLELYRLVDILAKVAALGPEVGGDRVLCRLVVSQQVLGVALTRRLVDLRTEDFPWRTQILLRTPLREEGGFRKDARARQSGPSHRSASTGAA